MTDTALDAIRATVEEMAAATRRRDEAIVQARQDGYDWTNIAFAAGLTNAAVMKIAQREGLGRYSRERR